MTTHPSILIIVPVYNEAAHILSVVESVKKLGFEQILVVNDGSTDKTKELLERNTIASLHHLINRGQGAAIQTGFDAARKRSWNAVVTMDGDSQCSPEDILALAQPILDGKADMVVGNRFMLRNDVPYIRRVYNWIGSIITWILSGRYLADTQSGMRAYNRHALNTVRIEANGYEFCSDMIRQAAAAKLRISEVPIRVFYTKDSMSKGQNFAGGLRTVGKLILRSIMR